MAVEATLRMHFHGGQEDCSIPASGCPNKLSELCEIISQKLLELQSDGESTTGVDPSIFTAKNIQLMDRNNLPFDQKRLDKFMQQHNDTMEECQDSQTVDLYVWHQDETINKSLRFTSPVCLHPGQNGLTRVIVQNAEHQMLLFFTELIDNADQATMPRDGQLKVDVRQVKFFLDMSWHAHEDHMSTGKQRTGRITIEDNGWGQDEHGLKGMAKIGHHIEREGHSGGKIGKYGIGFNGESMYCSTAAIASFCVIEVWPIDKLLQLLSGPCRSETYLVIPRSESPLDSLRVLLLSSSDCLSAEVVNWLEYDLVPKNGLEWQGTCDHRKLLPDEKACYMRIDIEGVPEEKFDAYIKLNDYASQDLTAKLSLELATIYYLHMHPPAWASQVFAESSTSNQLPSSSGSKVKRREEGSSGAKSDDPIALPGEEGPFDPYLEKDVKYIQPIKILLKLKLPTGDGGTRATGLPSERLGNVLRDELRRRELETQINDMSLCEQTSIYKAIHPKLREANGNPNRALMLQFAFPNPECKEIDPKKPVVGSNCDVARMRVVLFYHPCDHGKETKPESLPPGLIAIWPNLGRVVPDFSFMNNLTWPSAKDKPRFERLPFMEPPSKASGSTIKAYDRITGLCFFNDAFEPDKHKQRFLKKDLLFAEVVKLFFGPGDKKVKNHVQKQQRLFSEQLSRWRKLDIEYYLEQDTQAWCEKVTITQLLLREAKDHAPKEEKESIPSAVDQMFRERPNTWSRYLRLTVPLPQRWESQKMIAGSNQLRVNEFVKIIEPSKTPTGRDGKTTSCYGKILRLYRRDYSGDSTSLDESYDDGGTDPFMLFWTYTWRHEDARLIRFRDLASLPVKKQQPRPSPPAQSRTDFEKDISSLKTARQPVTIDFDTTVLPRTGETTKWQTTQQTPVVEVVTKNCREEPVCDRYMRAQLNIKWRATDDEEWGDDIAQLEIYPDLQQKKYIFDVRRTSMGYVFKKVGFYKLIAIGMDHVKYQIESSPAVVQVVPGEPHTLTAEWVEKPLVLVMDLRQELPPILLVATDATRERLPWNNASARTVTCSAKPLVAGVSFSTPTLRWDVESEDGPELRVHVKLEPTSALRSMCLVELTFAALELSTEHSRSVITANLHVGAPDVLMMEKENEERFKARLGFGQRCAQSVDPNHGVQHVIKLQLFSTKIDNKRENCVFDYSRNDLPRAVVRILPSGTKVAVGSNSAGEHTFYAEFNPDGTCEFREKSIKLMGYKNADASLRYGDNVKLEVVVLDSKCERALLDCDGNEITKRLPEFRLVGRRLRLSEVFEKHSGHSQRKDCDTEPICVAQSSEVTLNFLGTTDQNVNSPDWRKDAHRLMNGDMKIEYLSPKLGRITCGHSMATMTDGKASIKLTIPARLGSEWLDDDCDLEVVVTGDMIAPAPEGANKSVVKLSCQLPENAPRMLKLAGPAKAEETNGHDSDGLTHSPDLMESDVDWGSQGVVVDAGNGCSFSVRVLDAMERLVSVTHYGWPLHVNVASGDSALFSLSGTLRQEVRDGTASFRSVAVKLATPTTEVTDVRLELTLAASPSKGQSPRGVASTEKQLPVICDFSLRVAPSRIATQLKLDLLPSQTREDDVASVTTQPNIHDEEIPSLQESHASLNDSTPRSYKLRGYAGTLVSLAVSAESMAGPLNPSELDMVFDGLASSPTAADDLVFEDIADIPSLRLPTSAPKTFRLALVDQISKLRLQIHLHVLPDTRTQSALKWVLKPKDTTATEVRVPLGSVWMDHLSVTLLDPHNNSVNLEEVRELSESSVRLCVSEMGEAAATRQRVQLTDLVEKLQSTHLRSVALFAESAAAHGPEAASGELVVHIVAGPGKVVRLEPQQLDLRNGETLPNIKVMLFDKWKNQATDNLRVKLEPSEELTNLLATPFSALTAESHGTATFRLEGRQICLKAGIITSHSTRAKANFVVRILGSSPCRTELPLVVSAGTHAVALKLMSPETQQKVAAKALTLDDITFHFEAENGSTVSKATAQKLVASLQSKWAHVDEAAQGARHTNPFNLPKLSMVNDDGHFTISQLPWPGLAQPGTFMLTFEVESSPALAKAALRSGSRSQPVTPSGPPVLGVSSASILLPAPPVSKQVSEAVAFNPPVAPAQLTVKILAGAAHRLQLGDQRDGPKVFPSAMENGDVLRYDCVAQHEGPGDGLVAAANPLLKCIDECGNAVEFPSGTTITAELCAESSHAEACAILDPPLNGLAASGVSVTLPTTRIRSENRSLSGTHRLCLILRASTLQLPLEANFDFHAERLEEAEKIVQAEIAQLYRENSQREAKLKNIIVQESSLKTEMEVTHDGTMPMEEELRMSREMLEECEEKMLKAE